MDDLKEQTVALIAKSQKLKCKFLESQFQTCWLAIGFGHLEQQLGSWDMVKCETENVEQVCQTILNVLPEIAIQERRIQFGEELLKVQSWLEHLKSCLQLSRLL